MKHGKHSSLMIGLVTAGVVLFLTGNVGGLLFLLWPLACVAMMGAMIWGMRGTGRSAPGPADSTHDDGLRRAHR